MIVIKKNTNSNFVQTVNYVGIHVSVHIGWERVGGLSVVVFTNIANFDIKYTVYLYIIVFVLLKHSR